MEAGHQKSRENNLEISGLPNSIDGKYLWKISGKYM